MVNFKKHFALILITCVSYCSYAQDKPQLVVTTGHHDAIHSISFSKNGRYVASGGADKILKIYDLNMQQEFNSIAGFSDEIRQVKFSSDNKYIFVLGADQMYTWSHPGGELLHRTNLDRRYDGLTERCYIGSEKIYIATGSDGLIVYDPVKGVVEKIWEDMELLNVIYLASQNVLVGREQDSVNYSKYNLNFYNASTGAIIKSVPLDGLNIGRKFVTDKDEEYLAIETGLGKVSVFNAKTYAVISKIDISTGPLGALEIYPDKKKIIGAGLDNKLKTFDLASGKFIQEISADMLNGKMKAAFNLAMGIYDIKFSPDGKTMAIPYTCQYDNYKAYRVGYYNTSDMTIKHKYDGQNKIFMSLLLNNDESKMVTGNLSSPLGYRIWNMKKGEVENFHVGSPQVKSASDKLVIYHYAEEEPKNSIRIFEFSTMKLQTEIRTEGYSEFAISPDGKYVAARVTSVLKSGLPDLNLHIWETATGKELFKKQYNLAKSPKGFCFNKANQLMILQMNEVECIDAGNGKTLKSYTMIDNPFTIWYEYDQTGNELFYGLVTDKSFEIRSMNTTTGAFSTQLHENTLAYPFMMKFSPDYSTLAVSVIEYGSAKPFKVYMYNWSTKEKIKSIDEFTAPVYQIDFGLKTGNMYFADNNGVVTILGNDYSKKAVMLAGNGREYMILSPENYYKTSIANAQGIGFRYKNELYRFDQFDLRYNRPDIVLAKMGVVAETQITLYKDAWLKRLKRLGFDEGTVNNNSIHAPEIIIAGKDNLPFTTAGGSVKFTVNASDTEVDLKRLAVYVNNIPVYGKNGFAITGAGVRKFNKEIELALEEGKNKISVSVFNNQGVESVRESFVIECTQKFPKPDLYILAIGVSKYQDAAMNLTYSDKDVNDVTTIFNEKNKTSLRFANVYVKLLTNEEATVANVDAAAAFLKNSKPNDQVILFFSGHGLIDQKLDYYLAMNNVDFTNPSTGGLLYSHFQDFFDGLQARKRLLLIDACHSGEYDKDEIAPPAVPASEGPVTVEKEFQFRGKKVIGIGNANELVKELFTDIRKETGATVIASSSGTEYSVESSAWKNGAFTFALKEALSDLKADQNKDKEITLSETREYLIQKVKELTGGKQNPTTRQENIEFDYRLW